MFTYIKELFQLKTINNFWTQLWILYWFTAECFCYQWLGSYISVLLMMALCSDTGSLLWYCSLFHCQMGFLHCRILPECWKLLPLAEQIRGIQSNSSHKAQIIKVAIFSHAPSDCGGRDSKYVYSATHYGHLLRLFWMLLLWHPPQTYIQAAMGELACVFVSGYFTYQGILEYQVLSRKRMIETWFKDFKRNMEFIEKLI